MPVEAWRLLNHLHAHGREVCAAVLYAIKRQGRGQAMPLRRAVTESGVDDVGVYLRLAGWRLVSATTGDSGEPVDLTGHHVTREAATTRVWLTRRGLAMTP